MKRRLFWIVLIVVLLLPLNFSVTQGQGDGTMPDPVAPPEGSNLPIQDLVFEADFTDREFWPTGTSTDGVLSYEVTDKGYVISSVSPDAGIGLLPVIEINIDDFYSEVTFTVDQCLSDESAFLFFSRIAEGDATGLLSDFYVYVIQCNGDWRSRPVAGGNIGEIDNNGQTLALEPGTSYSFGVLMVDNQMALYLNGEEIEQYEVDSTPLQASGALTPGAQLGFDYTLTDWRVWTVKTTGQDQAPDTGDNGGNEGIGSSGTGSEGDPVGAGLIGAALYRPSFVPPTTIPLGLDHPVAAYVIDGGEALALYNNQIPAGILQFDSVQGSDYYLEALMLVRDCADSSSVGFVWRADGALQNYYTFEVQCDGEFRVYPVIDGEAGDIIVSGRFEPALTGLGEFTMGIYTQGEDVWLYLDGDVLSTFSDSTFSEGRVGLRLASGENEQRMDILVGDLAAYALP